MKLSRLESLTPAGPRMAEFSDWPVLARETG